MSSFLETDPDYHDPDDQLRELLEREHLILEMQATPGWALWRDFLAAEAAGYQNRLLLGSHKDLLEYQRDAGFLAGIRTALGVSDVLRKRVSGLREILAMNTLAEREEVAVDQG